MSSDGHGRGEDPAPEPRPYAQSTLPTPRALLKRAGFTRTDSVIAVISLFALVGGAFTYMSGDAIGTTWLAIGSILVVVSIAVSRRQSDEQTALADVPQLGEVYLARRYAIVASCLVLVTVIGMLVLSVLVAVSASHESYTLISATTETIAGVGALASIASSYGLVKVILSHAPPFKQTLLNPLEESSVPEIIFTLGLIGCPAYVFTAAYLWNQPEIFTLEIVINAGGVIVLIGGATSLYTALTTRL